jgi:hypothetical protein
MIDIHSLILMPQSEPDTLHKFPPLVSSTGNIEAIFQRNDMTNLQ